MRDSTPRVAFFTDSFDEVNGVALTSREFARFARSRFYPFLCVHAGSRTDHLERGAFEKITVASSRAVLRLEHDLSFDLLFPFHRRALRSAVKAFQPDLVHITGPGHIGLLGALVAHDLGIPLAASWHTNVHEFGSRRLLRLLDRVPSACRTLAANFAEKISLDLTMRFYRLARLAFAPNPELVGLLESRTGRPTFLMPRGIDTSLFSPARRRRTGSDFVIGCVGRLSTEKNVRLLASLDQILRQRGVSDHRFLIVGDGSERAWLRDNLSAAHLPGILRGEDLARAYAAMDAFVFPSETDTFGNVVLEAMASGVPVLVSSKGGPKFLVRDGVDGFIAGDVESFAEALLKLYAERGLRARMSESARSASLGRSWDTVFEGVYRRYREAFANGALPRPAADGLFHRSVFTPASEINTLAPHFKRRS